MIVPEVVNMVANLRQLRQKQRISQRTLGDAMGVSQQTINLYENHKVEPDIYMLIKMADYFGTTIDYLVGHTAAEATTAVTYPLNAGEAILIEKYRMLSPRERESIRRSGGRCRLTAGRCGNFSAGSGLTAAAGEQSQRQNDRAEPLDGRCLFHVRSSLL